MAYDRANFRQENFRRGDSSKEKEVLREEARSLRLFAQEFGQGVRQQRVRDKTKEKAGTPAASVSKHDPTSCFTSNRQCC